MISNKNEDRLEIFRNERVLRKYWTKKGKSVIPKNSNFTNRKRLQVKIVIEEKKKKVANSSLHFQGHWVAELNRTHRLAWYDMASSSLQRITGQGYRALHTAMRPLARPFSTDALVETEIKSGEIGMVSGIPEEHLRRRVYPSSPPAFFDVCEFVYSLI